MENKKKRKKEKNGETRWNRLFRKQAMGEKRVKIGGKRWKLARKTAKVWKIQSFMIGKKKRKKKKKRRASRKKSMKKKSVLTTKPPFIIISYFLVHIYMQVA
jgi:hypothetical protein